MIKALNSAFSLLTTLPTRPDFYPEQPGHAYAYFPLVGIVVGGIIAAVTVLARHFFSVEVSAALGLIAWVLVTGGLHLDGFGDSCDGLFAQVPRERRLEIMKDPRAGNWAVIGLCLLLLTKWAALRTAPPSAILIAAVTARGVMVAAAWLAPYARPNGMGAHFKHGLGRPQVMVAAGITLAVWLIFWRELPAVGTGVALAALAAWWVIRRLGGLTGDVYGALCELTETAIVLFS
ncbi:MAG: adenosylcobinamide-GDP ribazoletransferase [Phototrophicaceae bacterium]